ncbi:hypothetical protein RD1_1991 [Roseobacter denitrificans OCh 114]|uniref:Uncharacterized protein n=1 Tax=Roseobacter denitrificans (strain ATCC 33942 / OCh 114) TaxID=375451 RepID=Q168J8_ROSDO|nr:hypothetical protein RD1_1991 [Roseobacter denitrificans OCh 114]
MHDIALGDQMRPTTLQKTAYIALLLLMIGVASGLMGGL